MKRQLVQTDRLTGKVINYCVDVGKGGRPIDAAMQSWVESPVDRASA